MEELVIQDKPGFLSRVSGLFAKTEVYEDEVDAMPGSPALQLKSAYRYTVTIRRQIATFDDAMAAANGLKRGEQQLLNLCGTDPVTRQKIVDFMCGVNFAQEGTWEEVGEHIYLIAPANAFIEVAPPTPRVGALRN